MPKSFSVLDKPQTLTASGKTVLVNTSASNIYLTDAETETSLAALSADQRNRVLNALFAIAPGGSKSLASGTYNLSFQIAFGSSAVLVKDV